MAILKVNNKKSRIQNQICIRIRNRIQMRSSKVVMQGSESASGSVSIYHGSRILLFLILFCTGRVPDPTSLFLPTSFLYVNLVAKGAPKCFNTLAPRLTVLDIPYFADAYSRTVRPIDLHNFFKANTQNPVGHDSAI